MTDEQESIIKETDSLVVFACAGTGKTTLIKKKVDEELKKTDTFKKIAAITFTIKATNDLKNRLSIMPYEHFVGTINRFAISEVIQPFFKDVYGDEYNQEFVIDYNKKINSFDEGLNLIKEESILGSYKINKKNFLFELASEIVDRSKACRYFLKAKYSWIFIDEYQDCDSAMHSFFMGRLFKLGIRMMIVGDENQAIYSWRGVNLKEFSTIDKDYNLKRYELHYNYRSCVAIQNYSFLLNEKNTRFIKHNPNVSAIIMVDCQKESYIDKLRKEIDDKKTLAVLRFTRNDSEKTANLFSDKLISDIVYAPPLPIQEISTDSKWLLISLAHYIVDKSNSEYEVISDIPFLDEEQSKLINTIKNQLKTIRDCKSEFDFSNSVKRFLKSLNYSFPDSDIKKLYNTISDKRYHVTLNRDVYQHIASTIHSSKGLEYDQVVVFTSDFKLQKEENVNLHYVAVTRAREKLILIVDTKNPDSKMYLNKMQYLMDRADISCNELLTDLDKCFDSSA